MNIQFHDRHNHVHVRFGALLVAILYMDTYRCTDNIKEILTDREEIGGVKQWHIPIHEEQGRPLVWCKTNHRI